MVEDMPCMLNSQDSTTPSVIPSKEKPFPDQNGRVPLLIREEKDGPIV